MSTVNLVPSWVVAMDILLTVLEDGTEDGKEMARDELREMAVKIDNLNEIRTRGAGSKRPSHWEEQPGHPVEDWQAEVANRDTALGYLDWVAARIEGDGS